MSKTLKLSAGDARDILSYIKAHPGNYAAAAHDVELSIIAIRPYTARPLEIAQHVLRLMAKFDTAKQQQWVAKLHEIANELLDKEAYELSKRLDATLGYCVQCARYGKPIVSKEDTP